MPVQILRWLNYHSAYFSKISWFDLPRCTGAHDSICQLLFIRTISFRKREFWGRRKGTQSSRLRELRRFLFTVLCSCQRWIVHLLSTTDACQAPLDESILKMPNRSRYPYTDGRSYLGKKGITTDRTTFTFWWGGNVRISNAKVPMSPKWMGSFCSDDFLIARLTGWISKEEPCPFCTSCPSVG